MKTLSCGILVFNADGELLLCHVTGAWHWDIPKGGLELGESPREAALRETREECGLDLSGACLLDLGRMAYRPRKDLHLFATLIEPFNAADCRCTSHYLDHWGRSRPEMDGFEWTRLAKVPVRCARNMSELLGRTLSLPDLMLRLLSPLPAAIRAPTELPLVPAGLLTSGTAHTPNP